MKLNKTKIIFFIIVLVILIILMIIFGRKWSEYLQTDSRIFQKNDNETYILKKDKHEKAPKKLKNVMDKKNPVYKDIDNYLKATNFNGTATVFENGKVKLDKGYGFKNFENGEKNSANTMYLIGSSQKFTTGLILKQLEVENKVNINDPVTKYLPWFKTSKEITLKDLMLYESGLHKYEASTNIKNLDQAVKSIQQKGIDDKFYHKHQYNDGNYLVLAKVIEKVTHKPYVENYYNRLANPYKLKHSAFFDEKVYQKYMARGYKIIHNKFSLMHPKILDQYYGAGNLYMAPHDMGQLILALQHYKIFDADVTDPLLHEFDTKQYPKEYRYGFYVMPTINRVNGVFFGQKFTVYYNDKYIVILASNLTVEGETADETNENKMKHVFYDMLHQKKQYNVPGIQVK
ncbi:serine hydrolase domain-containing protein [Staphylococcus warneri]|uniref:serine hydrolase domain-containing protein n=1 Tax=Staphylococcus warneri TaxID=1292 RepID=UPI001A8F535C|nr:serine hydrolase domain-containing protein [Staphylococcus warneri]MBO0376535.1 beta-lactamase family protein [Staphylococcus warneri]